jgi:hypothetical protein
MTPKEKADDLMRKFEDYAWDDPDKLIDLCLLVVEEVIKTDALIDEDVYVLMPAYSQYWESVKSELLKMRP